MCLHSKGCPRELDGASDAELATLSADAGVPIEWLREMATGATMARIQGWLMTEEGRAALDEIRVSLRHMVHRVGAGTRDGDNRHVITRQEGSGSIDGATIYVTS